MGNCSHRAVSDGGGFVNVVDIDSRRDIMEEYYRSRRCTSLPITRKKSLGYLVGQGTPSPIGVGPKIQVSPQRRNGVWKAKVVMESKQLKEILAVEGNTHALIDQLQYAAAEALVSSTSASDMVRVKSLTSWSRKNNEKYFC
ncbi:PREDICTED: uncharacterized protein LOC104707377 [Camelina sativa]|uniref:Uncharacterized protein LOC104707377 n=1 Tax=Camelina sativa TaxID=90675 RepID=A0ABM0T7G0_CAMSA|nr:PREDICTED: uncharacterized protein LOC104707377 [Camelina sativa]